MKDLVKRGCPKDLAIKVMKNVGKDLSKSRRLAMIACGAKYISSYINDGNITNTFYWEEEGGIFDYVTNYVSEYLSEQDMMLKGAQAYHDQQK